MGLRHFQFKTWYLEQSQAEKLGPVSCSGKNIGNEFKVVKRENRAGMGGPNSEDERQRLKKQVLCPEGSRAWVDDGLEGRVESLQERLEAAEVKAATTATRNKNKVQIPKRSERWRRQRNAEILCLGKRRGRQEHSLIPGWVHFARERLFRGPS